MIEISEIDNALIQKRRAACVDALTNSLEIFTGANEDSFEKVIARGFMPIATAIGLDRIAIYNYKDVDGKQQLGQVYRWDMAEGGMIPLAEGLVTLPHNSVVDKWIEAFSKNEYIFRCLNNMSEEEKQFVSEFSVYAIFLAPVFQRGELWGVVAFQNHHDESNFYVGCEDLLVSVANVCATALIREEKTIIAERAVRTLKNREKMLNALNEMAVSLLSYENESFEDVISKGLKPVTDMAGVDRVAVYRMLDGDIRLGQVYLWYGQTIPLDEELLIVPLDPPVVRWLDILTKGGCINAKVDEMDVEESAWLRRFGAKCAYFVPIFTRGRFWGVVTLEDHTTYRYFEEDSLDLLQSVAHLCADVVLRADMTREIRQLETEADKIYIDALTGIYNRRYFEENLESIVRNLSRSAGCLSIMMIDIDFFKNYNDTYGHSEGDKCLQMIAETLNKSIMRTNDFIARYGGEEFVVVLPNTDKDGACMLAAKFLDAVWKCQVPHKASAAAEFVTISIGVTTGIVHHMQTGDDYVVSADELLYTSKREGRNRYTFKEI